VIEVKNADNKQLKILHLISGGDSGGAKTHLFSLLDKLKNMAFVRVGCLMEGVFYKEICEKDVESVLFRQKNRFDLSVVDDIVKMINEEHFDVFHVHGARANFVAGFVKKRVDVPIVTTVHSDYLLDFDDFVKKLVFTNLNKASLKKMPYFIAVSDNFKDMLIERGFRPNSIYTVYNGMDFDKVPKKVMSREEYARARGFVYDEKKVYVGIAARFDVVKGVDVFIKAAGEVLKKRNNIEFLIAGDGAERERLVQSAQNTPCPDKIHFLGYENDMYSFLNFIDINTLTSKCESFPYSMLEGAAMAKPMVASRVGGIPSLVRDYETGLLFESGDYVSMAEKLIELADDKLLREELGQNIYDKATTLCSNESFAKTHIKIYKSIIADYKDKKKYDFVVSGYYGFNNNGDDALLLALIEDIKRRKEDARIVVLSAKPEETKKMYRVDSVNRINPIDIVRSMKNAKVLLSGGGSLLQDETSSKSLWYYLIIIRLAKLCKLKVMQFANGFGPVTKPKDVQLTKKTINECVDLITLRDEDSMKEMDKIGVTVKKELTADPAMLLEGIGEKELARLFENEKIDGGEYISVSVREWKKNAPNFEKILAQSLKKLSEEKNWNVVFVPMQFPNDVKISENIAKMIGERAFVVKKGVSIAEAIGIIGSARLNVAMRLHAMIYSVSGGVKTLGLKYDPKVEGFMRYAGPENTIDVENLTEEELDNALRKALEDEPSEKNEILREKAKRNSKLAVELL
jgi:polysaccharide pyruvyl transferase CsaB